jgi:hypothetical protein
LIGLSERFVRILLMLCLNLMLVPLRSRRIAANSRARSVLFSSLSLPEFERVSDCATSREIWVRLQSYHEGTVQVKIRLFKTYKREYENFSQLDGESIGTMFSHFQTIVNKMQANKA